MRSHIKMIFALMAIMMIFASCTQAAQTTQSETETKEPKSTESSAVINEVMLSLADVAPSSSSQEGISDVQLGFNLALLKQLGKADDGNLFYSSMSINAALTMAYFGADGETQKEIAQVLGYGEMDIQDVAAYQKYLLKSYEDSGDTTFTSANSIWIDDELVAKQDYISTMNDVFDTEVRNLDLQANGIEATLNSWIEDKTNGMIKKLYDEGSLSAVKMVLMNAIYFNGEWTTPFDADRTERGRFNGATATSTVSMMSSNDTVRGNVGDDYKSVFMPYGEDERFQMVAVLPDDMESFLSSLTKESLKEILSTYEEKDDPILALPSFEMEQKVVLNDALNALGINKAFTELADLSLISDDDLYIGEVLHKAKIKVDEEGTEAAAVTGMTLKGEMISEDRFEFVANKPFLFFIVDTENDLVLFTGKVMDLE